MRPTEECPSSSRAQGPKARHLSWRKDDAGRARPESSGHGRGSPAANRAQRDPVREEKKALRTLTQGSTEVRLPACEPLARFDQEPLWGSSVGKP